MGRERIITFGCRLNALESEVMRRRAEEAGLGDAILVNTCAVTAEAVRQARQAIRKARRDDPDARDRRHRLRRPDRPAKPSPPWPRSTSSSAMPRSSQRASYAPDFGLGETPAVRVNDIMSVRETAGHLVDGLDGRARAFVEVQNGCDHRCTFCIIPYGRGNSRSVPMGAVVEQVRRLVDNGYREVVLTGVDITSYGGDLPGAPTLGTLVRAILRHVPDLPRLRLSSIDSIEVDDALMRAIAEEERLMPHLHLSLQPGDDMILKRMKRRHLRADAVRFADDGAPPAPRRRLRRRPHRRLPDRDRGDVRQHARHRRRLRPDPSARLPLLAAPRHAGRAHAAARPRAGQGARRAPARQGRGGARRPSRRRAGRHPARAGRARRPRPHRALHRGRDRLPARPGAIVAARITGRHRRASSPPRLPEAA